MSAHRLLLVDDSQAILAYETAALSRHYSITTATNGKEALDRVRDARPAAILLDLSMPVMTGDEVLAYLRADPELCTIPTIIVSSERERAEACLALGATAYLPKPLRAEELRAVVERVLAAAEEKRLEHGVGVLVVVVGTIAVGLPLDVVRLVASQPMTRPLSFGSPCVSQTIDLHGERVLVVDLAELIQTAHASPVEDRTIIVVAHGEHVIALSVDHVREPELVPPSRIVDRAALGVPAHPTVDRAFRFLMRAAIGEELVPIVELRALFSPELARQIDAWCAERVGSPGATKPGATP